MIEATISSVHETYRNSTLTCEQLVEMYLDRIETFDKSGPKLNSVITINPSALEIANKLDKEFQQDGITKSLHGIPVLLKDNINTCDMATTAGSIALEKMMPFKDAYITKKLKEAGALILAKTNLHEFAIWGETTSSILGQTLNPYDLTRTPGGSSGGSAAAIAANFGIISIGTDTINSIRSPASACNLVGLRPTMGLVDTKGVIPYSLSQDTAGPIMRNVEDTAKVLEVISGGNDYTSHLKSDALNEKRIGVLHSFFGKDEIHKEVNSIIFKCLKTIEDNGGNLIDIKENFHANYLVENVSVHLYELKAHLNEYLKGLGEACPMHSLEEIINSRKYHLGIEENIIHAQSLSINSKEYIARLLRQEKTRILLREILDKYSLDAIVYPHQKRPVVKVGEVQVDRNGVLGSVTGFPSIVVPGGFTKPTDTSPLGVPVGIEFLGRPWNEHILLEIAYAFEQITKFRKAPIL